MRVRYVFRPIRSVFIDEKKLACIAADEQITPSARYGELLEAAPVAATVLRVAARAGRLAGEADGRARAAEALVKALRGGELPPPGPAKLDLGLFESDLAIQPLFAAISAAGGEDISLLLTGPPGTGKTTLAQKRRQSPTGVGTSGGINDQ